LPSLEIGNHSKIPWRIPSTTASQAPSIPAGVAGAGMRVVTAVDRGAVRSGPSTAVPKTVTEREILNVFD